MQTGNKLIPNDEPREVCRDWCTKGKAADGSYCFSNPPVTCQSGRLGKLISLIVQKIF